MTAPAAPGRLLVVGTPIGNLADLSPRAAEALRTADLLVAEDTRLAARLLAHVGARTPTISFNAHNAAGRLPGLLARLVDGATLALTTDAGMPAVSDPGARLVAAARAAGARIESVPGPSAATTAMALAGIEAPGFLLGGFLPARPAAARRAALARLLAGAQEGRVPLVLFEAPHRVRVLLGELAEAVPEARVVLCRELTKRHEQVLAGTASEVAGELGEPRGELTLVIGDLPAVRPQAAPTLDVAGLAGLVGAARDAGLGSRTIVELLRAVGVPRRVAYGLAQAPSTGARHDPRAAEAPGAASKPRVSRR